MKKKQTGGDIKSYPGLPKAPVKLKPVSDKESTANWLKQVQYRIAHPPYEPSNDVKNSKAALAAMSMVPGIGYISAAAGTVGDFYTGTRYLLDGQGSNALFDYGQGLIGLVPEVGGPLKLAAKANRGIKAFKAANDLETMAESPIFPSSWNLQQSDKKQRGGAVTQTGYLPDSPDRFNDFNIIPSNVLTMDTVPHDVLAIPNNGKPKLMKKNSGKHTFAGADYVTEVPMYWIGGELPHQLPAQLIMPTLQDGGSARLVSTVPEGYNFTGERDGRKYYSKRSNLAMAQASGAGVQGGAQYENFLRTQLGQGTSPEELANKRYISRDEIERYRQFFKPQQDTVYTEGQPPTTPTQQQPQPGFRGTGVYNQNKHLAGLVNFQTKNSQAANDPGMLNTQGVPANFMFVNQYGQPDSSKGVYQIPGNVWSNQMSRGTNTLYDTTGISQYRLKDGGSPKIKPENRGKFTAWAKRHGMSVGEATSHVLANKGKYSEGVRKMAQFSRNFGGHQEGGQIFQQGGSVVDYMEGLGQNSSFSNRKKIFEGALGSGYKGTAEQNQQLLAYLHGSKANSNPGMMAPAASELAMHITYDPANRNKLYANPDPRARDASYGCVNCRKPDIDYVNNSFPQGDTLLVGDSKKDKNFADIVKKVSSKKDGGKLLKGGGCVGCGETEIFKEGGHWIQKATKNMRTDHPCTGSKFGGPSCPPGSRRYNLAKTFRSMNKKQAGGLAWDPFSQPLANPQQGLQMNQQPGSPVEQFGNYAIHQTGPGQWRRNSQTQYSDNVPLASGILAGMSRVADQMEQVPDYRVYNNQVDRGTSDARFSTHVPSMRRGAIDPNSGHFAPDQQTLVQYSNQPAPSYYGIPYIAQDGLGIPEMLTAPDMGTPDLQGFSPSPISYQTQPDISQPGPAAPPEDGYNSLKEFVKKQEGFDKKAFWDYKQYTNGYGTKAKSPTEVIDKAEADRRLDGELGSTIQKLKENIKVPINNSQLTALASLSYNGGYGVVRKIVNQINKGADPKTIADMIRGTATTVNNGAQVLDSLVKRRGREANLYQKQYKHGGEYDLTPSDIQSLRDQGYEVEYL